MRTLRYQRTNGAYIESTDRMLYKNTEWVVSKTAYSVVLITDTLRLRIDPNKPSYPFFSTSNISKEDADAFGLYYTGTQSVAKNHFDGEAQTTALINLYNSKGWNVSSLAAGYCRTRFDGRGYLASAGEMDAIYHTYSSILNPCLTAIGAAQINSEYWVSTCFIQGNVHGWVCRSTDFTYTFSSTPFPIQCVSRYD